MSKSSSGQPGRPTIPLSQAARLLRKDWRTVKRMVESGELEGGSTLVAKRRTYYVYADQLAQPSTTRGTDYDSQPTDTVAELRQELMRLRASEAQAREAEARAQSVADAAQETNRLLQANQAILLSAVKEFHDASDATAELVNDYRALTDRHWSVAGKYRSSAQNFAQAADNFQNILGRMLTPDDVSALTSDDQTQK